MSSDKRSLVLPRVVEPGGSSPLCQRRNTGLNKLFILPEHSCAGSGAIGKIKIGEQPLDVVLKQPARLPIPVEYGDREHREPIGQIVVS
jgi:hypothetical protein